MVFGGLTVRVVPMSPGGPEVHQANDRGRVYLEGQFSSPSPFVRIDPGHFPALRDQWHRRLDVKLLASASSFTTPPPPAAAEYLSDSAARTLAYR